MHSPGPLPQTIPDVTRTLNFSPTEVQRGGSSYFKIDTANGGIDLILVLSERAKIAKMDHYTEEACFKIGNIMERQLYTYTETLK